MKKDEINQDEIEYVSKSEIKREKKALEQLARNIIALSKSERSKLPLTDELVDAILLADKIKNKPDPLRRHVQFMVKLLDESDLDAIEEGLDFVRNKDQRESRYAQQFEQLREQLINEGDQAIQSLLEEQPSLERQKLRQLVRQANKEAAAEKPAKGYRELYKYLKDNISF
jgi:ribosome-associated protein